MDATVKAIFFLVAVVLAVIAAFADRQERVSVILFPLAFAVFVFPFMWDAFEAA